MQPIAAARTAAWSLVFAVTAPFATGEVLFTEQATQANLTVTHAPGPNYIAGLAFMIAGGAVGDFNNDGWQDIYVVTGGTGGDKVYINQQNGQFSEESSLWGLTDAHMGAGVAVGDYNGDGFLDLYVTSYGDADGPLSTGAHRLYRNENGSAFARVFGAGVEWTDTTPNAFSAAFGDYDLDGDLDLFVTGWITGPSSVGGNRLFRNNGDEHFTDVTVSAGIFELGVHGFSPRFADMNGDRYPELLLAADFETARYYVNDRDGTFTNFTAESGTGLDCNAMGQTIGDFNNDGLFDWYVTNIFRGDTVPEDPCGNMLYVNQANHLYTEQAAASGVNDGRWGWGTLAIDVDHDGYVDIVEVNGFSDSDLGPKQWENQPARLFMNNGALGFVDEAMAGGFTHTAQGRGVANFDYDNDGDQDVVVFSFGAPLELYRNDTQNDHHWLRVFLDTSANPSLAPNGFGTQLRVRCGGDRYYRYVDGGSNYLSQGELSAHFGLGNAAEVDELLVTWADGATTIVDNIAADQTITIAAPGAAGDCVIDGHIDLIDFDAFQSCVIGSVGGPLDEACQCADFDDDGDVDLVDFGAFQAAFTGSG